MAEPEPNHPPQPPPKANDELWGRVTASQYRHRKFRGVDLDATGLWTLALSWTTDNKTDGLIPEAEVPHLSAAKAARVARAIEALVARGLWERVAGGFQIHDFLDFNASAAYLQRIRDAGKKGAVGRWGTDANRNADRNADRIPDRSADRNAGLGVGVNKEEKPLAPPNFYSDKARAKAAAASRRHQSAVPQSQAEQETRERLKALGPCPICGQVEPNSHDLKAHQDYAATRRPQPS